MRRLPATVLFLALALSACSTSTNSGDATSAASDVSATSSAATTTAASASTDSESPSATSDAPSLDDIPALATSFADPSTTTESESWGDVAGGDLDLVGVTVDGNRLLITLAGDGDAAWYVHYTESPTTQGKGDPVDVDGAYVLEVVVAGLAYPEGEWEPTIAGTTSAAQVVVDAPFEGQAVVFIGRDSYSGYRVGLVDEGILVEFED